MSGPDPAPFDEAEHLREALLDLERTRARQKEALDVAAQLLRCLRTLGEPREVERILPDLLRELRGMLGFEDALLLASAEGGELRAAAVTSPRFEGTRWTPGSLFRRAAAGAAVSVFDVGFVEEWKQQPAAVAAGVKSALHVGLHAGARTALLVCTHAEVGFFAERHRRLAEQLAPLASQALEKAERAEELARVNAALRREVAEREEAQRALQAAQRELLATARRAGMTEVTTSMLHHIGNTLNSVHAAVTVAKRKARTMPVDHVGRAADLLATLAGRLAGDRRAEALPEFLARVGAELLRDRDAILAELASMASRLDHVTALVETQHQRAVEPPARPAEETP